LIACSGCGSLRVFRRYSRPSHAIGNNFFIPYLQSICSPPPLFFVSCEVLPFALCAFPPPATLSHPPPPAWNCHLLEIVTPVLSSSEFPLFALAGFLGSVPIYLPFDRHLLCSSLSLSLPPKQFVGGPIEHPVAPIP